MDLFDTWGSFRFKFTILLLTILSIIGLYIIYSKEKYFTVEHIQKVPVANRISLSMTPTEDPTDAQDGSNLSDACNFREKPPGGNYGIFAQTMETLPFLSKTYVDLGNNNLQTLTTDKIDLNTVKEISLVDNDISADSQQKIIQQFPNIKIYFFPQKYQGPQKDMTWKEYTSAKGNISFFYHPELEVTEKIVTPPYQDDKKINQIEIKNSFASYRYTWMSCALDESYIRLSITWNDEEDQRPMEQYLTEEWQTPVTKQGDSYIVPYKEAQTHMLGKIESFNQGNFHGVILLAGEAGNERYIMYMNNRYYIFTMGVGGQTGSTLGKFPKELMLNILASIQTGN
jgi:hypothetical protein